MSITRCIDDESFPGIVECELVDSSGQRHLFVDKIPIFSLDHLNSHSIYPQPGVLGCRIVASGTDAAGHPILIIDTMEESVESLSRFEVASTLVTDC
jgi:hypothetical protein